MARRDIGMIYQDHNLLDDRLEVWSTGTLPPGMTVEKLKGTHESMPRNPLVATVFHRRGLVERWGRGTNKIIEECERAGCPEPDFEETGLSVVVRFRPAEAPKVRARPPVLGPRAAKIVQIVSRGPLGAPDLLRELAEDVTLRSLQTNLRALREAGRIVAVGKGRALLDESVKRLAYALQFDDAGTLAKILDPAQGAKADARTRTCILSGKDTGWRIQKVDSIDRTRGGKYRFIIREI